MKKLITTISLLIIVVTSAAAQIREIVIDLTGRHFFVIEVARGEYVTVSQQGELLDVNIKGRRDYYKSIFDEENGRLKSVGGVRFEYNTFTAFDEIRGRIKRIGNISFDYNTTTIYDELKGTIRRIGTQSLEYYDSFGFSNEGKAGKLRAIGRVVDFDYYSAREASWANESAVGLLSRINDYNYFYSAGMRDDYHRPQQRPSRPTNSRPPGNRPSIGSYGGHYESGGRDRRPFRGETEIYLERAGLYIRVVEDLRYFMPRRNNNDNNY